MFFNFLTFKSSYSVPDDILYMDNFFFFNHPCLQMKKMRHTEVEYSSKNISRWMHKKAVVHIHNGVLLSRKKEYIWISSDEMDETGADYTEWIKPERKTPIQYTNTYIWNSERWQWWPCMQDSKKDTDVYSRLLDSGERESVGWFGRMALKHIISYKKWITILGSMQDTGCLGLVDWDDPERWYGEGSGRGVQDWEHVYTCCRFMLMYGKTNTVL